MGTGRFGIHPSAMLWGIVVILLLAPSAGSEEPKQAKREQVGEVLGRPVYRDQFGKSPSDDDLHEVFAGPVMKKYREAHRAEVEPTKEEIAAVAACLRQKLEKEDELKGTWGELRQELKAIEAKLKQPGLTKEKREELEKKQRRVQEELKSDEEGFAWFLLQNWKLQKHLYDRYGGGRILWQQAGQEAFDATRKWLESREKLGEFKITDPDLRATFYEYWTTMNHGAFLFSDKDRIRKEFLEPEWLPKAPAAK